VTLGQSTKTIIQKVSDAANKLFNVNQKELIVEAKFVLTICFKVNFQKKNFKSSLSYPTLELVIDQV